MGFFGFGVFPPFDHPRHLKSGVASPPHQELRQYFGSSFTCTCMHVFKQGTYIVQGLHAP